ncbi:MAG: PilZ domain-containing protein [Candidatus Omnitrophica bacterium]|nr:PilZ domain-containing protein [Candidatus Omnitrophota bacterium]
MIVAIEILVIVVLVAIVLTLVIDEGRKRAHERHLVTIKTYWDGINRRRAVRHNTTLDVLYTVNHTVNQVISHKNSRARDISTHGIGLVLSEKLPRRTMLSLLIKLDKQGDSIRAKAAVMWCKESLEDEQGSPLRLFYTGLKFIHFADERQERRLFDYIRSLEQDSSNVSVVH